MSVKDFHPVLNNAKLPWLRPQGQGDATFKIPAPGAITRVRLNLGYRLRDAHDPPEDPVNEGAEAADVAVLDAPSHAGARTLADADHEQDPGLDQGLADRHAPDRGASDHEEAQ